MTNQFLGLMLDPFVDGRTGAAGLSGPAIGFAPEREAVPNEVALAYAAVLKAPPVQAPSFEQRWSAWGGAYGGGNRTSGDPAVLGSHDLTASTAGFAGGLDYRVTPDTVVGVALAGGGTSWSLANGLGGGKSDAFQAGACGATRWGAAYVAAALSYTHHWMSTDRFAFASEHLTASFNAQSIGARSGERLSLRHPVRRRSLERWGGLRSDMRGRITSAAPGMSCERGCDRYSPACAAPRSPRGSASPSPPPRRSG